MSFERHGVTDPVARPQLARTHLPGHDRAGDRSCETRGAEHHGATRTPAELQVMYAPEVANNSEAWPWECRVREEGTVKALTHPAQRSWSGSPMLAQDRPGRGPGLSLRRLGPTVGD